jgi:hypothetical protein
VIEWTDSLGRPSSDSSTTTDGENTTRWPSFSIPFWGKREAAQVAEMAKGDAATPAGAVGGLWQRVTGGGDRIANSGTNESGQDTSLWRMLGLIVRTEGRAETTAESAATNRTAKIMSDKALRQAFDAFDADSSGTIDQGEMATMVAKLGLPLSANQIDKLMAEADVDNSVRRHSAQPAPMYPSQTSNARPPPMAQGEIDFDEFRDTLRNQLAEADGPAFAGSLAQVVGQASALLGWLNQGFELNPTGLMAVAREAAQGRRDATPPAPPTARPKFSADLPWFLSPAPDPGALKEDPGALQEKAQNATQPATMAVTAPARETLAVEAPAIPIAPNPMGFPE